MHVYITSFFLSGMGGMYKPKNRLYKTSLNKKKCLKRLMHSNPL